MILVDFAAFRNKFALSTTSLCSLPWLQRDDSDFAKDGYFDEIIEQIAIFSAVCKIEDCSATLISMSNANGRILSVIGHLVQRKAGNVYYRIYRPATI
mmetsp:Transcript_3516/g.8385  ORF Transcript_3516/g.8385 Transcript_3516/m.8385 type:complete len:98 (+) Transcript_3516:1543-1836(+)